MAATEISAESENKSKSSNQRQWSTFLLIALALHIPFFFYPIIRLGNWLDLNGLLISIIFLVLGSSQIMSRVYLRHQKDDWAVFYRKAADFWMGLSPVLLISLLVFELIVAFTDISPKFAAYGVIGITILGGIVGLASAMIPMIKKISLSSDKINQPLRFVQITDVHIGSRSPKFLEKIISSIIKIDPDFLCITGDFIDETGVQESDLISLKRLSCPIYFCLGNHEKYEDLEDIIQRLKNLGVHVLQSDALMFREDVQVLGIDDMEDPLQVEKELRKIDLDEKALKVLLYHRPRGLEAARDAGVDLIISGHTHNGQIFPFNFAVSRVFDRTEGMYQLGSARQYVSQGTGTWGPVIRMGTRSEITLFEYSPEC